MEPWPFSHGYPARSDSHSAFAADLQWSHGPSAMDTARSRPRPAPVGPFNGAMALQPWIRVRRAVATYIVLHLQWSHGPSAMDTVDVDADVDDDDDPSMEPWPFSHGYENARGIIHLLRVPSMEPWPFSHGYAVRKQAVPGNCCPFNGAMALQPWIHHFDKRHYLFSVFLQWSHGPSAMDTPPAEARSGKLITLQWSHGPSAMDTPRPLQ